MKNSTGNKIPNPAASKHPVFDQRPWPSLHCAKNSVFNITHPSLQRSGFRVQHSVFPPSAFSVQCSTFSVSSFSSNQQSPLSGKALAISILLWNDPNFEYYEPILELTGYQMRRAPKKPKLPAENLSFNIYPNPARDYITVAWEIPVHPHSSASLIVTDAMGRELMIKSLPSASGEMMIDIATLPKGVFTVWLVSNKKPLANRKLVVIN